MTKYAVHFKFGTNVNGVTEARHSITVEELAKVSLEKLNDEGFWLTDDIEVASSMEVARYWISPSQILHVEKLSNDPNVD